MNGVAINTIKQSMVAILGENETPVGAGFFIRTDGYLITCHHVIFQHEKLKVRYCEEIYEALWVEEYSDPDIDIAILKITITGAKVVTLQKGFLNTDKFVLYGFLGTKLNKFPQGCEVVSDYLYDSVAVSTLDTYINTTIIYSNPWNKLPLKGKVYESYRVPVKVDKGFSGGAVFTSISGGVIGIVQSSKDNETRIIKCENIVKCIYKLEVEIIDGGRNHDYFHLPENFVERAVQYEKIIQAINNYSVVALVGFGGYGKTVLANWIGNDSQIKRRFEKIISISVGKKCEDENLTKLLVSVVKQINDNVCLNENDDRVTQELVKVIGNRSLLLVIDDVWSEIQLKPFLQGGPYCVRLITTRNYDILPRGAEKIKIDGLDKEDAQKLIKKDIHVEKDSNEDLLLNSLCLRLGNWAQLLSMINRSLWEKVASGKTIFDSIKFCTDRLDEEGVAVFDPEKTNDNESHKAIRVCIEISIEDLNNNNKNRFFELLIFPENEHIPLNLIAALWKKTSKMSENATEDLCYKLNNRSLFESFLLDVKEVKLHNNIYSYLRSQWKIKEDDEISINNLFLNELYEQYENDWSNIPQSNSYLWRRLTWHLRRSKRLSDIEHLLTSYKWIKRKVNAVGIHELIYEYTSESKNPVLEKIGQAVFLSFDSISKNCSELSYQLWGRLAYYSDNQLKILLQDARIDQSDNGSIMLFPSLTPPGSERLRIIGHGDVVYSAKYITPNIFPNSKAIITISKDATAKLWSSENGLLIYTFYGHEGIIKSLSCSKDGLFFVTSSEDTTAIIWNTISKSSIVLDGHSDVVNIASFSSDGKMVVTASDDNSAIIWDAKTGKKIKILNEHEYPVNFAMFSPDNSKVVTASKDNKIIIWDIDNLEKKILIGHTDGVNCAIYSNDGTMIISASDDNTARIWNLVSDNSLELKGHIAPINTAFFSHDQTKAITSSHDQKIIIWNVRNGEQYRVFNGHTFSVLSALFSHDDQFVVSSSSDKTSRIWDVATEKVINILRGHEDQVIYAQFSEDDQSIITASHDHSARVWNSKIYEKTSRIDHYHVDKVNFINFSIDEDLIITTSDDKTARIWKNETGGFLKKIDSSQFNFTGAIFSLDKKMALLVSDDKLIEIWDLDDLSERVSSLEFSKSIYQWDVYCPISFIGGKIMATITNDDSFCAFNSKVIDFVLSLVEFGFPVVFLFAYFGIAGKLDSNAKFFNEINPYHSFDLFVGHDFWIKNISLSDDGLFIAILYIQNNKDHDDSDIMAVLEIKAIDLDISVAKINIYEDVLRILFSPDNSKVIIVIRDKGTYNIDFSINLWDINPLSDIIAVGIGSGILRDIVFSSDSSKIVVNFFQESDSLYGSLKLFDLLVCNEFDNLKCFDDTVVKCIFSNDNFMLIILTFDKLISLWEINTQHYKPLFHIDAIPTVLVKSSNMIAIGDNIGRLHLLKCVSIDS